MIVLRKIRGPNGKMPDNEIKSVCLHELLLQSTKLYADENNLDPNTTTLDPPSVLDFLDKHYKLLSDPFSKAQSFIVQALISILNHEDHLKIIQNNKVLLANVVNELHQNLNYNIILDCTVFRTPSTLLIKNPSTLTTYFLIIQTKSIFGKANLIRNFSDIKRKITYKLTEFFCDDFNCFIYS